MSLSISNHQTQFAQGINEAKAKNFFITEKNAKSYGISDTLFARLDVNKDGKINWAEAQSGNDPSVLNVYKTKAPQKTEDTNNLPTQRIESINPIQQVGPSKQAFMKNAFAFENAHPDRPESRSQFSVDLLNGAPIYGKNLYLLG